MKNKILSIVVSILIAVLGWMWTTTFSVLVGIEKELKAVQIEIAKVQSVLITEQRVREIIKEEMEKTH